MSKKNNEKLMKRIKELEHEHVEYNLSNILEGTMEAVNLPRPAILFNLFLTAYMIGEFKETFGISSEVLDKAINTVGKHVTLYMHENALCVCHEKKSKSYKEKMQ